MQAVIHEEGRPLLELAATDWGFPLLAEQDGVEFKVFMHLSPYTPAEMKAFLPALMPQSRVLRNSMIRMEGGGGDEAAAALFDRHFLTMGPLEGDPDRESILRFLEANPQLKTRAVTEGYGGVRHVEQVAVGPKALRIMGGGDTVVKTALSLFCPVHAVDCEIVLEHRLRAEKSADAAAYQSATSANDLNTRQGSWKRVQDYDALEKLYDSLALGIEGAVYRGAPAAGAGGEWLKFVPLWHKVQVVDEVFRRTRIKNV